MNIWLFKNCRKKPQNYGTIRQIVFEKKQPENLPPHRDCDIAIELIPGGQLYFGPIYSLTVQEMKAL